MFCNSSTTVTASSTVTSPIIAIDNALTRFRTSETPTQNDKTFDGSMTSHMSAVGISGIN